MSSTRNQLPVMEPSDMKVKFVKFADDKCFGEKYDGLEQCKVCWVKQSCHMRYKNRK